MEILGHSQLAITTDLYSHVMPTALREAADAMDRRFVRRMNALLSPLLSTCCLARTAGRWRLCAD